MFTGIVEEVGTIVAAERLVDATRLVVRAPLVREGLSLGDSVAVNGVCLTVAALTADAFEVVAVAATLSRTTLGRLGPGHRVNLERAMALGARLGGHLVQGHVDGVGELVSTESLGDSTLMDFSLPPEVAAVTILHGSITIEGVSLTVNRLPHADVAQVSIIPYTWDHTTLSALSPGDAVNLEGDLIGKYVRHLMGRRVPDPVDPSREWGY